jgi:ADP-ribose pyrophosphatase YjhB (NUDIX family)
MHRATDSVRIVLFDAGDAERFLVVTEADDVDNWKLPGGKFEHGADGAESPAAAAERELAEEVGVSTRQVGLRAAAELINDDGVSARYIFAGKVDPQDIAPTDEIAQVAWFTQTTLPNCKNKGHIVAAIIAVRG